MPRPRRVTGPAKENWWKSSDIDEQRNQLQQDQWNKTFNQRLSDFNNTRKAQQRSQQAVQAARNFSRPNTSSERQSMTRTDVRKTEQQRTRQWEDEFKRRSTKRK